MISMASKVVSTKLTEEEYGKLIGLSSKTGFTISKLLKRAILARMNEEKMIEKPKEESKIEIAPQKEIKKKPETQSGNHEERFLYY